MTIEERLENMERELGCQKRCNRRLLGAMLLLAGGLIVAGAFKTTVTFAQAQGSGTAKEVRANSFVLVDENGKGRAILYALQDYTDLLIWGVNGKSYARLSVSKDGPKLALSDENGKDRATLLVSKDGPWLALSDEKGQTRAGLDVTKDGPKMALYNESGKSCAALNLFEDEPRLTLGDENGKIRVWLSLVKGCPVLNLYDQNGKRRTGLSAAPGLALWDEKGQIRFAAGKAGTKSPDGKTIEYPESSLILFGPDGKVIWSAIK